VIELQRSYGIRAAALDRNIDILIGLPSEEAVQRFLQQPQYAAAPSLCELDLSDVRRTNAVVWAPAWTRGPMATDVSDMHAEGRRVFFWTLDREEFIRIILRESAPDGMVTNYPSVVAYEYYAR
jgi:glycerophosphoryl diester phosphodiesterase